MKEPGSMDECVYFTRRKDGEGSVVVWVFKEKCPKCEKALMGKPINSKTGRPKIRASEYVCPKCGYTEEKDEYESKLTANIKYECSCGFKGELQVGFDRKKTRMFDNEKQKKVSVEALVFECGGCKKQFYITKKMK